MSAATEQKRRRLTIALGVASAISFGGLYGLIAGGGGSSGANAQAAVLALDQSSYSQLTSSDDTIAEGTSDGEGEAAASVATAAPAPATTRAPVATPKPVTKTRGS